MTALRLPRPRRLRPIGILAAAVTIVAAGQLATIVAPDVPRGALPPGAAQGSVGGPVTAPGAPLGGTPDDLAHVDRSIARWTSNLGANEHDFIAAHNLAVLYEGRARLSGDVADYARAAEAASRSLAIEPRQLDVQALHARILLSTHDFPGALAEAEAVDRAAPDQPAVLAIIGDAKLELGDVDGAAALYGRIEVLAPSPAVTARLARIAFLRGDPSGAVALAASAHQAAASGDETGPARSWYAYLAGTLSMSGGAPEAAAAWFDRALEDWPSSYLALAGRARAAAALGDLDAAIEGYRAAIAIAPQPEAVAALGDLLALRGDAAGAEEQYATVEAIARLQSQDGLVANRPLALFLVNHDRSVDEALRLAESELVQRKDAYGYDALAWALLANGRAAEADTAIRAALDSGTRDALFLFHGGEIARALGDDARARTLLEEALAIRGALDPLAAASAADSLAGLR